MNWVDNRIPSAALLFLLPLALVEPPASVIAAAGDGGFWSFLPGFGLAALGALAAALLARRHPGRTLAEILRARFGRTPGTFLAAGYSLFWFATAAWLLRVEASKVVDLLLPITPIPVVMGYMLVLAAYLAAHGVEPVARWSFAVLPGGLGVALAFYLFGLRDGVSARLLDLPPGGVAEALREAWRVAGTMEGVALPLALSGFLTRPERLVAATAGGMAIAFVGLAAAVALVLLVWGVRAAALYHWPAVTAVQTITLPGFLIEKLDLVYLAAITMLGVGRFLLLYLMAALTVQGLFPSVPLRTVVFAQAPPLLAVALLPPHFDTLEQIRAWLTLPTWGFVYALPALGLVLSFLRPSPVRGVAGGGSR